MALISLNEAAARIHAPRQLIEEWARRGLLTVQALGHPSSTGLVSPGAAPTVSACQGVDEDELADVAESMGWWELTIESWDRQEDE